MDVERLNKAFNNFTAASKTLEASYATLQEKVIYLTSELEIKNRQLSDALADAEENKDYLQAVLYNIEEAIIVVDPENRVTMMNRSAERLLRARLPDAIGKPYTRLDFSLTNDGADEYLTVNGKRHVVIVSRSEVVDSSGLLRGSVILIKDVTRIRDLELQHERNERLIAMGEMAAKIVHEIRNPLCSIELFSTMLEKETSGSTSKELAAGISAGIGNLNTILANMLIFARPHKPALKTIRLDCVIADSISMVMPHMESRKIIVEQSLHECEIPGDGELLKQAFMNIIINAIQAMNSGGKIEIRMKERDDSIAVRVKDGGEGIKREIMEKIFDPFFSTKDAGTGLGLAIASQIMLAHGGAIRVESEVKKGSTFSLLFPRHTGDIKPGRRGFKINVKELRHADSADKTHTRG